MNNKKSDKNKELNKILKKLEKANINVDDVLKKANITREKFEKGYKQSINKFIKFANRALERDKIIEANRKYDEKIRKKQETKNEKIFEQFPWVKNVMLYKSEYKNINDAKKVYDLEMNKERNKLKSIINEYFEEVKNTKEYKTLIKSINNEKNIDVFTGFNDKLEYIIQAYGAEEEGETLNFALSEDELLEKVHGYFRLEQLEFKNINKGGK